jgi:hypothetical protein
VTTPLIPGYDRANVIVGLAALYYQVYNAGSPPAMPADTVLTGAAWPAPWTRIGATNEGVNLGFARETADIRIEEQANPVDTRTQTLQFTFTTVLAEDTLETMLLAFGGGTITAVAAGVGTWGYRNLVISDEMTDFSLGFEGKNKHGYPRRFIVPIVKSVAEVESPYRRAEKHMYNVTFRSLSPLSQSPIHDIVAPPTA